jgi:hypothetical protein
VSDLVALAGLMKNRILELEAGDKEVDGVQE